MATISERQRLSRLVHRFGFGPKPGEFAQMLKDGYNVTASKLINIPTNDSFSDSQPPPIVSDQGSRPAPNSPLLAAYKADKRAQQQSLIFWWLDRMVLAQYPMRERMTWFWHGHWATSAQKVDDALPLYLQNQTLRKYALGNFSQMAQAMVNDGALIYWLDGQTNTIQAPNENLSRELMELFTLGVNRYNEKDVKETAKALTGYRVNKTSGAVTFLPKQHYSGTINFLQNTGSFDATSLAINLVSRDDSATFIAERIWYRFINSSTPMSDQRLADSFADRDISKLMNVFVQHSSMSDAENSMVKSPVEWFVSVCKALAITPSKLANLGRAAKYLENLGQLPFYPPNVGGWPVDQAWLTASSAQYRIQFAGDLVRQSDLTWLKQIPANQRVNLLADWLGVASWSTRTQQALIGAQSDVSRLSLLAICSPEYLVNA